MTGETPGRRVVVTRPRTAAHGMMADLTARGLQAILLPTVSIRVAGRGRDMDALVDRLPSADWLVCTSATAVRALHARLLVRGITHFPVTLRVAAVGSATATALRRIGVRADVIPTIHSGPALVEALGDVRGRVVLFPRADIARVETRDALRDAGAIVHHAIAYRTVPARPDAAGLRELERGVDAIMFTSPSTAENFVRLLGARAEAPLAQAVIGCIGPTTAAAARAIGARQVLVPGTATARALVAAIANHLLGAPS